MSRKNTGGPAERAQHRLLTRIRDPLPKPDAFCPRIGIQIDDNYLPDQLRGELRAMIPLSLRDDRAGTFLDGCAQWAQLLNEDRRAVPAADQVSQLEEVEDCARALQRALRGMAPETIDSFDLRFTELMAITAPAVHLTAASRATFRTAEAGFFLGAVWDLAADLEAVATYSISRAYLSKTNKVSTQNARRLVWCVVGSFRAIYKATPPTTKSGWFARFMAHLAEWDGLKLSCGPALLKSVVRAEFAAPPSSD